MPAAAQRPHAHRRGVRSRRAPSRLRKGENRAGIQASRNRRLHCRYLSRLQGGLRARGCGRGDDLLAGLLACARRLHRHLRRKGGVAAETVHADDQGRPSPRQPREALQHRDAGRFAAAQLEPVQGRVRGRAEGRDRQGQARGGWHWPRQGRRYRGGGAGAQDVRLRDMARSDGSDGAVQLDALPHAGPQEDLVASGLDPARPLRLGHDHELGRAPSRHRALGPRCGGARRRDRHLRVDGSLRRQALERPHDLRSALLVQRRHDGRACVRQVPERREVHRRER